AAGGMPNGPPNGIVEGVGDGDHWLTDVFDGDGGGGDHGLPIIGPAPGEPNDVIGDLVNVGLSANVGVPGANGGVAGAN
ncbi:hypothetical protein A2U01_0095910, partial [Trifolium medium]|nr:hypothetical protein [Trifolium medium]